MNARNHKNASVIAGPVSTPSGASNTAIPPSRTPIPFRLIGSSVNSVTVGTSIR